MLALDRIDRQRPENRQSVSFVRGAPLACALGGSPTGSLARKHSFGQLGETRNPRDRRRGSCASFLERVPPAGERPTRRSSTLASLGQRDRRAGVAPRLAALAAERIAADPRASARAARHPAKPVAVLVDAGPRVSIPRADNRPSKSRFPNPSATRWRLTGDEHERRPSAERNVARNPTLARTPPDRSSHPKTKLGRRPPATVQSQAGTTWVAACSLATVPRGVANDAHGPAARAEARIARSGGGPRTAAPAHGATRPTNRSPVRPRRSSAPRRAGAGSVGTRTVPGSSVLVAGVGTPGRGGDRPTGRRPPLARPTTPPIAPAPPLHAPDPAGHCKKRLPDAP